MRASNPSCHGEGSISSCCNNCRGSEIAFASCCNQFCSTEMTFRVMMCGIDFNSKIVRGKNGYC
ncbi:Uncharacterised protein [Vibrio cholerae]|nr:Uncharacterised protein [Vibrio cholerae]